MKKVIAILLVLLALGTVAFAKEGFTLRGGFSYDFINIKGPETAGIEGIKWRANAFGIELGVTYNFSDNFLLYGDSSLGFYNKFKLDDVEITNEGAEKSSYISTTEHVGAAYDFNMKNGLDLQVGAGFAFEYARVTYNDKISDSVTESDEWGTYALGFGLFANVGYSFSDRVSVTATLHPDFMVFSGYIYSEGTTTVVDNNVHSVEETWTTIGGAFSFKFNAAVGITFKF